MAIWIEFQKSEFFPIFLLIDILYFDALITNMIIKIANKIIFKYLKNDFFYIFRVLCEKLCASKQGGGKVNYFEES